MNFVTGGTGLVGARLLFDLTLAGEPVRAMKRADSDLNFVLSTFKFNHPNGEDLFNKIEWVNGDLLDVLQLEELVSGCTHVYHAAAMVSFQKKDRDQLMLVNAEGTANLVNACLGRSVKKFCFVSSIAAFGREPNRGIVTEESQWKRTPYNSNYAISKYAAEREVWRGTQEGLDVVILNPSVIIGPCPLDKSTGVLFRSVLNGLPFYTLGTNGFVDVRDVSRAMMLLMKSEIRNERFILNGENLVFRDFFNLIAKSLNKKPPHIYAKKWMSAIAWRLMLVKSIFSSKTPAITKESVRTAHMFSNYSNEKLKQKLGFEFTPIKQSVQHVGDYLRKEGLV
jgi:nucleoside-diphosphate-sugar epimerase